MRNFNETDRKKKSSRISLPENPGALSTEKLLLLEQAVRSNLIDGYVACRSGWKIANDLDVTRIDVGSMIDKLGIRVTDCQLGCFKVSKMPYLDGVAEQLNDEAVSRIRELKEAGGLTCKSVHDLAHDLKAKPISIANMANAMGCKIRECQLGCF